MQQRHKYVAHEKDTLVLSSGGISPYLTASNYNRKGPDPYFFSLAMNYCFVYLQNTVNYCEINPDAVPSVKIRQVNKKTFPRVVVMRFLCV